MGVFFLIIGLRVCLFVRSSVFVYDTYTHTHICVCVCMYIIYSLGGGTEADEGGVAVKLL